MHEATIMMGNPGKDSGGRGPVLSTAVFRGHLKGEVADEAVATSGRFYSCYAQWTSCLTAGGSVISCRNDPGSYQGEKEACLFLCLLEVFPQSARHCLFGNVYVYINTCQYDLIPPRTDNGMDVPRVYPVPFS